MATVVGVITSIGVSAGASGAVATAVGGAIVGASVGAINSAIQGDNILKGAIKGGLIGVGVGVAGGLMAPEAVSSAKPLGELFSLGGKEVAKEAALTTVAKDAAPELMTGDLNSLVGSAAEQVGAAPGGLLSTAPAASEGFSPFQTAAVSGVAQAGAAMMAPDPAEGQIAAMREKQKIEAEERERREKEASEAPPTPPPTVYKFQTDPSGKRTYTREPYQRPHGLKRLEVELDNLKQSVAVKPVQVEQRGVLAGGIA